MMNNEVGKLGWLDLTVDDAATIKEFYKAVVGWDTSDVSQGEYNDYCVHQPGEEAPVAGICHKRGVNSSMPSQWMMYVNVADMDASMAACEAGGGQIIIRDRNMGSYGRMSVIQDPAGAVLAIMEPAQA